MLHICFIHEEAHTNVRSISCVGHQLYAFNGLGVDLDVESVRYIEMHRGPAAHVLGSPPSRDGDLELEGGVSVLVKIWRSTWNTYLASECRC